MSSTFEARAGFEPANEGFADLAIGPLWYRAIFCRKRSSFSRANKRSILSKNLQIKEGACSPRYHFTNEQSHSELQLSMSHDVWR
jgi:hypothetical protein